jgi:formamidopyrimidine-DNA glycosylase
MPELVEVEQARVVIAEHALGREIVAVDDADTFVCRPHAPGEIADALVGRVLVSAHRRGKAMWARTSDDGPDLGLHLGMAGRILVDTADGGRAVGPGTLRSAPKVPGNPAWDRFTITFADGGTLRLRDKRRLGRVVLDPDVDALGPDALEITAAQFRARVGRGAAPLKARLMDQSVLAGVGNLLADEVLWQAVQPPVRPAGDLDEAELDELRRVLRSCTRRATRRGGVHTGDVIAERHADGHCPRCGAPMTRGTIGGRTTWWCSAEQAWRAATPDRSAA